jgi:DNA polymerase-3 subunit epsilon/CBS domain-containing protein
MAVDRNARSLIALDAVVLDTETTGLDPRTARVVEIAAVRLVSGRLDAGAPFRRLVQPGEPIPASAIRIHGIDAAVVAGAPIFTDVWAEFSVYCGGAVLIGHAVGFDCAVLARECARIGQTWRPPLTLDTQMLAQIAEPELAGYSLENVAARLEVEIINRHSALGDATASAKIFCALVPRLRERGIRTLGEAMRACRSLTNVLDQQHRAGWAVSASIENASPGQRGERVDTYPYRHRVGAIMTAPARSIGPEVSLGAALERLMRERTSSLFVFSGPGDGPVQPDQAGIVTEQDVLRALDAHGAAALAFPVRRVMSKPLLAVPASAFAYLAIGRMNRLRVRHLGVTDDAGHVIGALSARDLLKQRAEEAVELGDAIDQAKDVHELANAWSRLAHVSAELLHEGALAREIAAIISHELGELTRRAAVLAEVAMKDEGLGNPPCRYAFVVLGSAGRGESLLAMDQDNALIFEDDTPDGADRWFEALAVRVSDILDQIGVPYCKGGVMAKNPQWRGSLGTWRRRIGDWIQQSNPQGLLSVDIFFDMRGVHGEVALADLLWREAFDAAQGNAGFAKLLLEAAGKVEPSRNWFGSFRTLDGRIDLKKTGLFGLVSIARTLAIRHHVIERSTPARLAGIKSVVRESENELDALIEAQGVFLDLILKQQIADLERGRPPSNAVEVKGLSRRDRERLRAALQAVENLDELGRGLLFKA